MPDDIKQNRFADEELIAATLTGETRAFGKLVERYRNMVFALALSRISNTAEAEDIAQESFLKAYSKLATLKKPCRFAGWLSRITLQECTNTVRRNKRRKAALGISTGCPEALNAIPSYSANPGLTSGQINFVRQTVRQLPRKFRKLIVMRFMGGLSAVQIAEQLGKRPGTVRVWLHRAYKILRKDLTPLFEEIGS
jgi:RNA polymerase sigma-70 factor (ECF subfamily)